MKRIIFLLFSAYFVCIFFYACSEDANPLPSKAHPETWTDISSDDFHGILVVNNGKQSCASCHGYNFQGGESSQSCYTCHSYYPHVTGWTHKPAEEFHGNYIRQQDWVMNDCKRCHGQDYYGGRAKRACYDCHREEGGPEACNVCHGSSEHVNPPEDLNNNTETTALGVGAHEKHLAVPWIQCTSCHAAYPENFSDPVHIDPPPADIKESVAWDRNVALCSQACHPAEGFVWNDFENGDH